MFKYSSLLFVLSMICLQYNTLFAQQTEKSYKVHEVEAGETLYGISKMYNISVADIWKANPIMPADSIIKEGMLLKIPSIKVVNTPKEEERKGNAKAFNAQPFNKEPQNQEAFIPPNQPTIPTVAQKTIPSTSSQNDPPKAPALVEGNTSPNNNTIVHEVTEGQTLYAIARKYSVDIESLKEWNQLPDYGIQLGSNLVIYPTPSSDNNQEKSAAVDLPIKPLSNSELPVPVKASIPVNSLQDMMYQHYLDAKSRGTTPQIEKVSLAWLKSDAGKASANYFALHKSAPSGTIIKISNLINKKYVFVKVIGKLPDNSENKNIVLKVSPAAKMELGLGGEKAYVETTYYP